MYLSVLLFVSKCFSTECVSNVFVCPVDVYIVYLCMSKSLSHCECLGVILPVNV